MGVHRDSTEPEQEEAAAADDRQNREYLEALARVARQAGMTPALLEWTIRSAPEPAFTADCLILSEVDLLVSGLVNLPEERARHIETCSVCQRFLKVILPDAQETADFVKTALGKPA